MKKIGFSAVLTALLLGAALAGAIAFGGPSDPPPMASINDPFRGVDFSDVPAPRRFAARDGAALAFGAYPGAAGKTPGSVVLIHGSSARGNSMHAMARAFATAGFDAYTLDVRGHGDSGVRGQIAYVGQLEDDLEDFVQAVKPAQPATLVGFSSGGGFVLRFAGSTRQQLFSNYLLLSPFLAHDAPTYRTAGGGWVSVGVPRIVGLSVLNTIGVHAFDRLPVLGFALADKAKPLLTPHYSFALMQNFAPQRDYRANIREVKQPLQIVAGAADELFHADRFAEVFAAAGTPVPVTLVPGIGHIALTLEPVAVQAAVAAVQRGVPAPLATSSKR